MESNQLFGRDQQKVSLSALSSKQKKILLNLSVLWSLRSDLEFCQLLDNITCLNPKEEILHDVTNEEFEERLMIQLEAFSQMRKGGKADE